MFKILDRYIVREVLPPFFLGLVVLTFLLQMPPMLDYGEQFIEKGVPWPTVVHLLATLIPQALGAHDPHGAAAGDPDWRSAGCRPIASSSRCRRAGSASSGCCGRWRCSRFRRPSSTLYVMIVLIPNANQAFREITFRVVASAAESDVKPRVFFEEFPKQVIYVRDVPPTGGWRDVFMADSSQADQTTVYFAKRGRLIVDRDKKTVELVLEEGSSHTTSLKKPDSHEGGTFDRVVLSLDAASVFRRSTLLKGDNEMTIAELQAKDAEAAKAGLPTYGQYFIQLKYSIPAACTRARARRPGAGRDQPQGRQVRELRPGVRRHFRLLHAVVDLPRPGAQRTDVAGACAVDPEHRRSAPPASCCSCGGRDRAISRSGSSCRCSCGVQPGARRTPRVSWRLPPRDDGL